MFEKKKEISRLQILLIGSLGTIFNWKSGFKAIWFTLCNICVQESEGRWMSEIVDVSRERAGSSPVGVLLIVWGMEAASWSKWSPAAET